MCWRTNYLYFQEAHRAKEDMTCYKVLRVSDDLLFSPVQGMHYIPAKVYRLTNIFGMTKKLKLIKADDWMNNSYIEKGFHSFQKLRNAQEYNSFLHTVSKSRYKPSLNKTTIVFDCTIPKGSQYYINEIGQMVSNKIVVNFPLLETKLSQPIEIPTYNYDLNITRP